MHTVCSKIPLLENFMLSLCFIYLCKVKYVYNYYLLFLDAPLQEFKMKKWVHYDTADCIL